MPFSNPADSNLNLILIIMWEHDAHYDFIDALRSEYYPPDLLWNPAHISLFARLCVPPYLYARVKHDISQVSARQAPFNFTFTRGGPALWHKFVVLQVESGKMCSVRSNLYNRWTSLNVVDRQEGRSYQPHVTIHGRVSTKQARSVFISAKESFKARPGNLCGRAVGVQLCEFHEGQPWRVVASFPFNGIAR